jgi:hypothetical protein
MESGWNLERRGVGERGEEGGWWTGFGRVGRRCGREATGAERGKERRKRRKREEGGGGPGRFIYSICYGVITGKGGWVGPIAARIEVYSGGNC